MPMDADVLRFLSAEVLLRQEKSKKKGNVLPAGRWQNMAWEMIIEAVTSGYPMDLVTPRSEYPEEERQAINSEQALLAMHFSCAMSTRERVEKPWPESKPFIQWVHRLTSDEWPLTSNLIIKLLSFLYLPDVNLSRSMLEFANLEHADLEGVNLAFAHLSRADFSGADLAYAILAYANLSGAHLEHADLEAAHLVDANLKGAKLADDGSLDGVIGLDPKWRITKTSDGYFIYDS
jgi:hypothetical protein